MTQETVQEDFEHYNYHMASNGDYYYNVYPDAMTTIWRVTVKTRDSTGCPASNQWRYCRCGSSSPLHRGAFVGKLQ